LTGQAKRKEQEPEDLGSSPTEAPKPKPKPKEEDKKKSSGNIQFPNKPLVFTSQKMNESDFPTMAEAAQKKATPKKKDEERPEEKKTSTSVPTFVNTKKQEAKETFSPLKEPYKDTKPSGELVAAPNKGREFQVQYK